MRRGSSNKVVEQQSSSSNTIAPIDTPSGREVTHGMSFCSHITYLCPLAYSSFLTKKQNQAARKILRFLLRCRHRWAVNSQHCNPADVSKDIKAHTLLTAYTLLTCPHLPPHTGANSWCCFTVPVKPIDGPKAYETGESFLPLLSLPLSWCLFACQWRQGERTLQFTLRATLSLSSSLRALQNDVATSAWLTDRGTVLTHSPPRGHVLTDITGGPCLPCESLILCRGD